MRVFVFNVITKNENQLLTIKCCLRNCELSLSLYSTKLVKYLDVQQQLKCSYNATSLIVNTHLLVPLLSTTSKTDSRTLMEKRQTQQQKQVI